MDKELVLPGARPKRFRVRVTGTTVEQTASGKTPKITTKDHDTAYAAKSAAEKLLRAKLRAGYAYLAPDAAPGEIVHESFGPGGGSGAVMDLSPDGTQIACATHTSETMFGATVFVVDVATGARRAVFEREAGVKQNFVLRLLFDRAGTHLVVLHARDTRLVDLASGEEKVIACVSGMNQHVVKPQFDRERRRLVVADNYLVRVLDAATLSAESPHSLLDVPVTNEPECRAVELSPSGRRLAIYEQAREGGQRVTVYDVDRGVQRATLDLSMKVEQVTPLDDDETLVASLEYRRGPIGLDLATGAQRWQLDPDPALASASDWTWSADGTKFVVGRGQPALYTWPGRESIALADTGYYTAECMVFSADGTRLAASCDGVNVVYRI